MADYVTGQGSDWFKGLIGKRVALRTVQDPGDTVEGYDLSPVRRELGLIQNGSVVHVLADSGAIYRGTVTGFKAHPDGTVEYGVDHDSAGTTWWESRRVVELPTPRTTNLDDVLAFLEEL